MGTIDMLPTIAAITDSELPDRAIDGIPLPHYIHGTEGETRRDEFVHYTSRGLLEGIRQGDWKLLKKRPKKADQPTETLLFNLADDLGEQTNLADSHPDLVSKLSARMEELDAEITNNARPTWQKK